MEYTINDVVGNAINGQPTELRQAVDSVMTDKLTDLLTQRREQLSKSLFNGDNDSSYEAEDEFEDDEDYEEDEEDEEDEEGNE